MKKPILHLLGLAKRAGKLEIGEEPVGSVARAKQAKLILLASDVPPNTSRRAATFGQIGNVLQLTLPYTKEELGFVLGRSSVSMVALTDAGFAGAIGDHLIALDEKKYGAAGAQLRTKADRTLARQKEKRQHEKNLQRGKGKPWAVPPDVAKEKKRQEVRSKDKSPNFKGKQNTQINTKSSSPVHDKTMKKKNPPEKNFPSKQGAYNKKTPSSHTSKTIVKGSRMVIKRKSDGSTSAKP